MAELIIIVMLLVVAEREEESCGEITLAAAPTHQLQTVVWAAYAEWRGYNYQRHLVAQCQVSLTGMFIIIFALVP